MRDHDIDPDAPDDYVHFDEFSNDEWPKARDAEPEVHGVELTEHDWQILQAISRAFPEHENPRFQTEQDRDDARRLFTEFRALALQPPDREVIREIFESYCFSTHLAHEAVEALFAHMRQTTEIKNANDPKM